MIIEKENYRIIIDEKNNNFLQLTTEQIFKRLLINRNLKENETQEFLHNFNLDEIDPYEFKDMAKAIKIISECIKSKKTIGVYGDFDADGLTGTAILLETIEALGGKARPFIPHRENEGHGISENGLNSLIQLGCELVITVDTGTNSYNLLEKIQKTNEIEFVITDHHIPEKSEFNYPILNPALDRNLTNYSGSGVAWILSKALFDQFSLPMKEGLTSLATIGTIADVAPLIKNNRILVKNGLKEIQVTNNFAIKALNNICGKRFFHDTPESEYISFSLAPRINTPGRIDDAYLALNLLTASNAKMAHNLSQQIEQMNDKRKSLSFKLWGEVQKDIIKQNDQAIIFIDCTGYPLGLLGPLAGRLVENLSKPVLCYAKKGDLYRFSSRSNDSYDLFNNLSKLEKYYLNFGGHSSAAGFSLKISELKSFVKDLLDLNDSKTNFSKKNYFVEILLDFESITYTLWDEIKRLSPFGEKNPDPVFFSKDVNIDSLKRIGSDKNHIAGKILSKIDTFDFIGFNIVNNNLNKGKANILYKLRTDYWNGKIQKKIHLLEVENS